jgi:hypothetical protein
MRGRPIPSLTSPALFPTHVWHHDDLAHGVSRVLAMSQVASVHHLQLAPHRFRRTFCLKASCRWSLWLGNPCPWLQPPDDRPAVTPRGHASGNSSQAVTPAPRHGHCFQAQGRLHVGSSTSTLEPSRNMHDVDSLFMRFSAAAENYVKPHVTKVMGAL